MLAVSGCVIKLIFKCPARVPAKRAGEDIICSASFAVKVKFCQLPQNVRSLSRKSFELLNMKSANESGPEYLECIYSPLR